MFGEEEEGAHSNKDAAVEIAKQAAATGLLTDMVTYLGMLEFESRKDLVGAAVGSGLELGAACVAQSCSCCVLLRVCATTGKRPCACWPAAAAVAAAVAWGSKTCLTSRPAHTPTCPHPHFFSRQVTIFGALVRIENNGDMPGLRYILENDGILVTLFDGWAGGWVGGGAADARWRGRRGAGGRRSGRAVPGGGAALPLRLPCSRDLKNTLPRLPSPVRCPSSPHLCAVPPSFRSYDDAEVALQCGAMFRDCIRHEPVARLVLESPLFPEMFSNLELSNFEVASGAARCSAGLQQQRGTAQDSSSSSSTAQQQQRSVGQNDRLSDGRAAPADVFATFKDLLTRHKSVVAQFLADNYADVRAREGSCVLPRRALPARCLLE